MIKLPKTPRECRTKHPNPVIQKLPFPLSDLIRLNLVDTSRWADSSTSIPQSPNFTILYSIFSSSSSSSLTSHLILSSSFQSLLHCGMWVSSVDLGFISSDTLRLYAIFRSGTPFSLLSLLSSSSFPISFYLFNTLLNQSQRTTNTRDGDCTKRGGRCGLGL